MKNIWEKVGKTKKCWNWLGELSQQGYGRVYIGKNKSIAAHRYIYQLCGNIIPAGMELDHLCRNRKCVNPKHLEPVTRAENIQRAWNFRIANNPYCANGHKYDEKTLYMAFDKKNGKKWRQCRKCRAETERRYRKRQKK